MVTSDRFLGIVRDLLDLELFAPASARRTAGLCFDYHDKFKQAPGRHFQDELLKVFPNIPKNKQTEQLQYIQELASIEPVPNENYVLDRVNTFVRQRIHEDAALRYAESTARGDFDQANLIASEAAQSGVSLVELGLDYASGDDLPERSIERKYLFPSGIPALDQFIRGFQRGTLNVILGPRKGKKSWFCVHLAKMAIMKGLNVLYITHELSKEEVAQRFDMAFGSLVDEPRPTEVSWTTLDGDGEFIDHTQTFQTVYNLREVKTIRRTIQMFKGSLTIKKFPMGTATVRDLRSLITTHERTGKMPDVVINDYADIMRKPPGSDGREWINEVYIGLKSLADEFQNVLVNPSQIRREADYRPIVFKSDASEDSRKIANCDLALGIGASRIQGLRDQRQITIVASRFGIEGPVIQIGGKLTFGQFHLWDRLLHEEEDEEPENEQEEYENEQ